MINDDLDEVSWYSTSVHVDGLRTRMNGVWLSANVFVWIVTQRRAVPNHATVTRLSKPTAHKLPH